MKNQTSPQHGVSFVGTELTEVRNKMLRAGVAVAILVGASAQAIIMEDKNKSDMPLVGEVAFSTVNDENIFSTGDSSPTALQQTFQLPEAIDVGAIWWQFRDTTGLNTTATLNLAIYEVDDVFAANLTLGTLVWSLNGVVAPGRPDTNSKSVRGGLEAGELFTLAARDTGTTGYAFQMENVSADKTLYNWMRTGASGGNPYAGGVAYDGLDDITGTRDFSFALQAVPEPSAAALAGMGLLLLVGRMRANRAA